METRICGECGGRVGVESVRCPGCGVGFELPRRAGGSYLHQVVKTLLGVWAVLLPLVCTYAGATGWLPVQQLGVDTRPFSMSAAGVTFGVVLLPWAAGVVVLGVLAYTTDSRA